MEKTKLNLSVPLFAAISCLLCYFGGYVIAGIVVGYVLLKEESLYLKKFCLSILALLLTFSLASTVIYLLPNLLELLYSFLRIFGVHFYLEFVDNIFGFFAQVLSFIKPLVFLLLGILALSGKQLKLPVLDAFLDKHL